MKILIYSFFISIFPKSYLSLIDIQNKKICADCKFFIVNKNECSKFGDVNIITGDHNYEKAIDVRYDETKCGEDAIFFKKNHFKFLIEPYKYAMNNGIQLFVISSYTILWIMFFTRFFN